MTDHEYAIQVIEQQQDRLRLYIEEESAEILRHEQALTQLRQSVAEMRANIIALDAAKAALR